MIEKVHREINNHPVKLPPKKGGKKEKVNYQAV